MSKLKVLAGDFRKGEGSYMLGSLILRTDAHPIAGESIRLSELATVEAATEESVKRVGGTVGWGVAGGVLLGPVGLLAGLLLGGKGKNVTFVATFKDGRRLLGTTDSKTYQKFLAVTF